MRKILLVMTVSMIAITGCKQEKKGAISKAQEETNLQSDSGLFTSENMYIAYDNCPKETDGCTYLSADILRAVDPHHKPLEDQLNLLMRDQVSGFMGFVDEIPENLETLGAQFLKAYYNFKNEFPESPQAWTIDSRCTEIFGNDSLISFLVHTIAYTGGAHPNQTARYVTYRKSDQHELDMEDLTLDTRLLQEALTDVFRVKMKLDTAQPLSAAGLFVEDPLLPINGNFAVVEKGLLFHYDPYEIGPYAMGAIDVEVPWKNLNESLSK